MRQLARAFIVTDAKEPGAAVTAKEALEMGLAPKQLADLTYELEMGLPQDEQDFEPFDDEDIQWNWAKWQEFASPSWTAPMRKYRKRDVLEMLMTTAS